MRHLFKSIRKASYFVPFSMYLIVFAAVLIAGYLKLRALGQQPDSAYTHIFSLLLIVVLFFSATIILFGLFTVFSAFLYFLWKRRRQEVKLLLRTETNPQQEGKQVISLELHPVLLPIAGFIKIRVFYDQTQVSEKFTPIANQSSFFKFSFKGQFSWTLPEIREYKIEKVLIYFEDFFQFFSMATTIDASNRFFISPVRQDLNALKASPRKTEETTTRIEELKRVEGELINYKSFETNDDVRRIVWKIYAKNKELVVRVPEIMDPYASHIYLYASFYTQFATEGNTVVDAPFLNYYKTLCWSVYQQLASKGFDVRYIADQPVPATNLPSAEEQVRYAITVSHWQNEHNLKDIVKPGNASVLIVSSLSDPEQLREFAESYGNDVSIIFIPLSDALDENGMAGWVKWLFVENEKDRDASYKTKWSLSPLRYKLKENEKEILSIIKSTSRATIL
jgi:heme/copper-type cytochrome/quinol oxidase subunit 2